jgi:Secretion system C-terminal sorting domain
LTINGQFNIDVFSPASGTTVVMQLNSISSGSKEATASLTTPGVWETLSFDFSAFSAINDFFEIRLIFNGGTAASGQTWCVDNLRQSAVTVNPCLGTAPIANIADDFECQRNFDVVGGQDQLSVLNNPDITAVNSSLKVGKYQDPANDPWTALVYESPSGSLDLSVYNHVQIQIWGPAAAPILFKLEGGTSPAVEVFKDLTTVNGWQKFDVDFSANAGGDFKKLAIFFNAGNNNPVTTYYIDNVKFARGAYNGCIDDHQTAGTTINTFKYFANGHLEAEGYQFEVINNPNPSGINTSSKVGKFVKASDGADFAGMYGDLDAPIDFQGNKTMKAKVHMDHIGNFAIKLEGSLTGAPAIELPVANTLTNQWEELTYNFSAVPDNAEYQRITLFFDLPTPATGTDVASYFDDISVGNNVCSTVGIFNPTPLEAMVISPNPVSNELKIENFQNAATLDIFNAFGQKVASVSTSNDTSVSLDVNRFPAGFYTIVGRNRAGILVGNGKFVKQ